MKTHLKKLAYLGLILQFGFSLLSLEICYAARPAFQAKFDQQNEQADILLEIALPEYGLAEENEWMALQCKDRDASLFTEKGKPGLFSFTYFISIPQGAEVRNITVRPMVKRIEAAKPIMPIPEPVNIGDPPKPPVPDEEIYNSSTPYPEKDFDYSIAKQGSTALLVLTLYPFKYVGSSKTLVVYEYTSVDIVLKSKTWKPDPTPFSAIDKNLKKKLVNPESAFFSGVAK